MRILLLSLALLLSPFDVCQLQAESEAVDPSRFEATVLVSGLTQPMELEVAPDGKIYYIELTGKLKVWDPATSQVTEVGSVTITTEQENGLIGMALDPKFAENHWIYLQYSPPTYPGQHISRFTLVDGKLDLTTEKLLFKFEEQRKECCHHAGSLEFGPDGCLFIATGDNTHPHADSQGFAPIDERPDRAPWDAQKSAANTRSGSGKILRIKPTPEGGYEVPDGNLFPKDGSKGLPEIYVMGCRNPWRMSVDQATGIVYWGEVGPDAGGDGERGPRGYDEINQARAAGNFGWPYFIADNKPYHDVDYTTGQVGPLFDVNGPINESPNNTGEKLLPVPQPAFIYYPGGESKEFPELGSGGRTACAGPVYHFNPALTSNSKFPAAYDRTLFIFEWSRHWVKAVHLDDQQKIVKIEPFLPNYKFVRPIDMQFGPEGSLYVVEYGETWGVNTDARLIRIDYVRGNRAPLAVASVENNIGKEPLEVKLSSLGTSDKDANDTLNYEWRVFRATDPERVAKTVSTEANPTITFAEPGVFNAELVVTDSLGASRSALVPVLVGNARPELKFVEPQAGDFYDADQPIKYRLAVSDAEDGTSDPDEAERTGRDDIDVDSPMRLSLTAAFNPGPIPAAGGVAAAEQSGPRGLQLMRKSDCFNCHAVNQKRVGPPYLDVANKYRGQEGALEASVQRVMKGSTGVWGKVPMVPHLHHTPDEVREMVSWVFGLQPAGLVRVFPGFVGEIPVAADETSKPGYYALEATYTDRGAGEVPAINASATLYLRQRLVEAEAADEVHGPQVLGSGNASGAKFIGAINHDHWLKFASVNLARVRKVTLKVASAGQGGAIEIRKNAPDGELLASVPVEVNGNWEQFYERTAELPESTGRHDLFIRFVNEKNQGGLMNLDSVHFLP